MISESRREKVVLPEQLEPTTEIRIGRVSSSKFRAPGSEALRDLPALSDLKFQISDFREEIPEFKFRNRQISVDGGNVTVRECA